MKSYTKTSILYDIRLYQMNKRRAKKVNRYIRLHGWDRDMHLFAWVKR